MSVGVMTVGEITLGEITVGVMTVGVMRRPRKYNKDRSDKSSNNLLLFIYRIEYTFYR